jgi:hypothetical protein
MFTSASSANKLILPRVRPETRGWVTPKRAAASAWVQPWLVICSLSVIIKDERSFMFSASAGVSSMASQTLANCSLLIGEFLLRTFRWSWHYTRNLTKLLRCSDLPFSPPLAGRRWPEGSDEGQLRRWRRSCGACFLESFLISRAHRSKIFNFSAAPHPPFGHLLPVRTGRREDRCFFARIIAAKLPISQYARFLFHPSSPPLIPPLPPL